MAPAADLELGTILSNTYKITGKLGEGGMGSVYRAEHQRLPRPYAIKVLHEAVETDSEFYHRFRREAEICSRLSHENIVEVVDFNFTPDGRPYIAMELLDGEDLDTRLEERGRLSQTEALEIVRQAAAGLAEAHDQGVIHRDLKPQNIFLCKRRQGGDLVKIVDFGISKIQGSVSVLTAAFTLVGTPYYMSPEQTGAGDGRVTARSDIYALGVIVYQMLSGEMPIMGESLAKIVMSINTKRPRPLRELVPQVSPAVEAVIDVALAKESLRRFASMTDFHEALRRAVETGDLMGISPNDSVAATVAAPDAPPPGGEASSPNLARTSAYDDRAFQTPTQLNQPRANPAQGTDFAPTLHTPMPQGLGDLGAAAADAVQSGPIVVSSRDAATLRERPVAAQGASNTDATTDSGGVSKTTLSSAAGEVPMTVALPAQSSGRGKIVALVAAVVLLLGAGGVWYALGGRGGAPGRSGSDAAGMPAGPADMTAQDPPDSPRTRPAIMGNVPSNARVVVRLKGLPPQASCLVDGQTMEGNPLVLRHQRVAVTVRCRAPGHRTGNQQIVPDRDQTITVKLAPLPAAMGTTPRPRVRPMRQVMRRPMRRVMRRAMRPAMRRRARPIDSDIPIE